MGRATHFSFSAIAARDFGPGISVTIRMYFPTSTSLFDLHQFPRGDDPHPEGQVQLADPFF
jgi:hypothetical protein